MDREAEEFLAEVDWVANEVDALVKGKTDIEKSVQREEERKKLAEVKKREEEERKKAEEEAKLRGRPGKGEKFDTYVCFCKLCFREFDYERELCYVCGGRCILAEERRNELMKKVEEFKKERELKAERKRKWENWKKTQAMLHSKVSNNYKKWDYFEDDDEEEETMDFVPPENDPNFKELERDIKERAEKRREDLKTATKLKNEGNDYFKQGKFRNALKKYEAAVEVKKDWMILYTNCAIAKIKLEDYEGAVLNCSRVLEYCEVFEEGYEKSKDLCFKALIRRGEAQRLQGNLSDAVKDFSQALDLKHDSQIETLLDRTKQEAQESGQSLEEVKIEEIHSPSEIISQLDTQEKITGFKQAGGYLVLFKRITESKDSGALEVLEYLCGDEKNYPRVQPLVAKVYDKKRIGAVTLVEAVNSYSEDEEWVTRIVKLLSLAVENQHVREELVKHSACTKGVKFCKAVFDLFTSSKESLRKHLMPLLSNLCLSKYKSAYERKPNPGNIKAIIRHNWAGFSEILSGFLKSEEGFIEALGLLCNMSSEIKVKTLLLQNGELVHRIIDVVNTGDRSFEVERSLGFLINISTNPTDTNLLQHFYQRMLYGVKRVLSLKTSTKTIAQRGFLLLFRILASNPQLAENLSKDVQLKEVLLKGLTTERDTTIKIYTAGASNPAFAREVPLEELVKVALEELRVYLRENKGDQRAGNLALCLGRVADHCPESKHKMKSLIEPLVQVVKEKLGPVRKNSAVCLAKLSSDPQNKKEFTRVHGFEVLSSVYGHLQE